MRERRLSLVKVNENFSTQTCTNCLQITNSSPKGVAGLGIREWICGCCGRLTTVMSMLRKTLSVSDVKRSLEEAPPFMAESTSLESIQPVSSRLVLMED